MRAGLLIICCLFILTSCKNKNKIPGGIIPPKKMQAILWDMMRADQFLSDFVLNKNSGIDKRTESIKLYSQVFAIHHISEEQYRKNFSYYKTHPVLFKAIMDSISQLKTEAPTEVIKQPVPKDSIAASFRGRLRIDTLFRQRKKNDTLIN